MKFRVKSSRLWPPAVVLENGDEAREVSGGKVVITEAGKVPGTEGHRVVVEADTLAA